MVLGFPLSHYRRREKIEAGNCAPSSLFRYTDEKMTQILQVVTYLKQFLDYYIGLEYI